MEISKHARETIVACGPREGPLFNNTAHQVLYHSTIKTLFTSFARCLQQLAFSRCEEAMDNDETSVSQLIGSPSGYKSKTNKHQGPVSHHRSLPRYGAQSYMYMPLHTHIFRLIFVLFFFPALYTIPVNFSSDMGAVSLNLVEQYTIHAKYRFTKTRRVPESPRLSRIVHRGRMELGLDATEDAGQRCSGRVSRTTLRSARWDDRT